MSKVIDIGNRILEWNDIKKFKEEEWKNDPKKVNPHLVRLVDHLAIYIDEEYGADISCIIHVAWEDSGHSTDGQGDHRDGAAVDLHFTKVTLLNQFLAAERFPFGGIGIYPYWNNPGLHLDIRNVVRGARWWRDKDGSYKKLNEEWLKIMMGMKNGS